MRLEHEAPRTRSRHSLKSISDLVQPSSSEASLNSPTGGSAFADRLRLGLPGKTIIRFSPGLSRPADDGFDGVLMQSRCVRGNPAFALSCSQALHHDPGALVGNAECPLNSADADRPRGGKEKVDGLEPKMERDVARLQYSTNRYRELSATITAPIQARPHAVRGT